MCIYEYLFKEEASKGIEIVVDNAVLVCVLENDICNKSILYLNDSTNVTSYINYCNSTFEYDKLRDRWIMPDGYLTLYLLPVTLGETPVENVLPVYNKEVILGIKHFIVEDVRSARRFLKKVDRGIDIDALTFYPLNKHTSPEDISGYLKPLLAGQSMGVISEAGCPAVADPGADVVAIAQRKNLKVVPLVGPSSIIMSVMGSGFNGQSFAFHGYLPIEPGERAKRIKVLEQRVYAEDQTQLFIETPYRNNKMAEDILKNCRPQTKLCIAANITCEGEYIKTKTIKEWQGKLPDLSKIPCIFLIYK